MINIDGRIYVTIKVDGNELPQSPNLIERITMTEGGGALSPAIELILNDYAGSLSKDLALTDGNELLITVGKSPNDVNTQSRQYRVFGIRTLPSPVGPRMQVIGIYDAPGYLTGSVRESFKSSTSDVVKEIASRCKLTYYGPEQFNGAKTNDTQVWLNVAKSRAMFVQQMSRAGYIDDWSVMFCVLTSLGQLRYLNLNDVIATPKEKIKRAFAHNVLNSSDSSMKTYQVREAKTRSTAGLMNTWQNYGSTKVEHALSGVETSHDKVEVKTTAEYLPINDTVKKTVDRSRVEYSALDCGNTHKNFGKAQYQNLKLLALYSEHVSIMTFEVTDLQPGDVCIYRQANADLKIPVSNSDIYLVIGKSIMVKAANYAERFELVRHNVTESGATELATYEGSSTAVADSVIPNSVIDPTSKAATDALPKTQTLNSLTKSTESSMSSLKAYVPDTRKAGNFLSTNLKGINDALVAVAKNPNAILQLVSQVKNASNAMAHYATMGTSYVNQMQSASTNMTTMANVLQPQNLSAAVRSTLLFKNGGALNAMTYNLGVVRQGMQIERILQPINASLTNNATAIKQIAGGDRIVSDFTTQSNTIIGNSTAMRTQSTSMWNSSASILHGVAIPDDSAMKSTNGVYMTNAMTNLYRAPASASSVTVSLDTATNDLGTAMMQRTSDRQVPFIQSSTEWDYDASVQRQRTSDEQSSYDVSVDSGIASYKDLLADNSAAESRDADATA